MYKTEIKNGQVILEGISFLVWSSDEWSKWKTNTSKLIEQCNRIANKMQIVVSNWQVKQQNR